jgi:hypothetical protein
MKKQNISNIDGRRKRIILINLILFLIIFICSLDDDDVYNNPNLHSKEQDELEIPNDNF